MHDLGVYDTWALVVIALALLSLGEQTRRAKQRQVVEPRPESPAPPRSQADAKNQTGEGQRPISKGSLGLGIVGALLSLPWLPIVGLNSLLVSLSLAAILPVGSPLFDLSIGGWQRSFYLVDIIAALLCLMQAVGGGLWLHGLKALAHTDFPPEQRNALKWLMRLSFFVTVNLIGVEVGTSAYRGWILSHNAANASMSALMSLGAGLLEVVIGALVLDFFIVPVLVGVCMFIATPFRTSIDTIDRPSRVLQFLTFLDDAIMKHFRALDTAIGNFVRRRAHRP